MWVKRVPWHRVRTATLSRRKAVDFENKEPEIQEDKGLALVVKTRQVPPRAFQVRRGDAKKHGYARVCPGRSSWFRGLGRQQHSAAFRERSAELFKNA